MQQGRRRSDIFVYDRNNASAAVEVIEAKLTTNSYDTWATQVDGYIQLFKNEGMQNVRRGTSFRGWYKDEFRMLDKAADCTVDDSPGLILRTFVVTAPEDGLLSVEELKSEETCRKD